MPYASQVLDHQKKEQILLTTTVHPFILIPGVLWLAAGFYAHYQLMLRMPRDHILVPILVEFFDFYVYTYPILQWCVYGVLFIGIIKILKAIIYAITTELVVTTHRVIGRCGFIRRKIVEIRHSRLESFETDDQSILGRLFRYGTINIHGTGSTSYSLHTINQPLRFREKAMRIVEEREVQLQTMRPASVQSPSSDMVRRTTEGGAKNMSAVPRSAPAQHARVNPPNPNDFPSHSESFAPNPSSEAPNT